MSSRIRTQVGSPRQYRLATRLMQGLLILLFSYGIFTLSPKIITNAGIGVVITFLPAVAKRNYQFTLDPFLTLWITAAVFFHAIGSAGAYGHLWWWDHFTHALSASVVAATGYVTVRILMLYYDTITIPTRFMVVYVVIFVTAFGVIWELFEYGLDLISATTGVQMPLAQHGLADTINDLTFNAIGAVVVALWGQVYLSQFAKRFHLQQKTGE